MHLKSYFAREVQYGVPLNEERFVTTKDILESLHSLRCCDLRWNQGVGPKSASPATFAHTDPVKFGQRKEASILMRRRVPG